MTIYGTFRSKPLGCSGLARFETQHDAGVLLVVIAQVLRAADPDAPERVSQRRYDEARGIAGHPGTPRADKLAVRFGIPWPVLRDRVLRAHNPAKAIADAAKRQHRRVLTQAAVIAAVRRVAARLDSSELSMAEYERERLLIDASVARSHTHGTSFRRMPGAEVIDRKFGFKNVVEAAGLVVPPPLAPPLLCRADAVAAFVEHYGFQPRKLDIEWFGRHHGIQLVLITKDPHTPAVEAAKRRFVDAGRWFPPEASIRARPEEWQHLGDGAPGLTRLALAHPRKRGRGEGYSLDEVRAAIAWAYDSMKPDQRLTADRYRDLNRRDGMPSVKTIYLVAKEHGTSFAQLVRDEAARRAATARTVRP